MINPVMKLLAVTLALLVLFAVGAPALRADPAQTSEIIAEVERKPALAREREFAWTVTDQYLAEARAAQAAGDEGTAGDAARRALLAVDASLQQADAEATAWRSRVPGS